MTRVPNWLAIHGEGVRRATMWAGAVHHIVIVGIDRNFAGNCSMTSTLPESAIILDPPFDSFAEALRVAAERGGYVFTCGKPR